jgi:hypothetical protein
VITLKSNEETGGLGISSSSRQMLGKVLNFIVFKENGYYADY